LDKSEEHRLKTLRNYQTLDILPEKDFDSITRLASRICKTPIALICFADESGCWFKSEVGFGNANIPAEIPFCSCTLLPDEIFEVRDASVDPRFASDVLVANDPHIRYYAGIPLISSDDCHLGSLCVMDIRSQELDEEQKDSLRLLAGKIISHLEVRKKNLEFEETLLKYEDINNMFDNSAELHCILDREANIRMINKSVKKFLGYTIEESLGQPVAEFLLKEDMATIIPVIEEGLSSGKKYFELETRVLAKSGEIKWVGWNVAVSKGKWYINGRDITYQKRVVAELEQLSLVASKVNNGVIISDANNNVLWVNEALENILGYTFGELEGKKLNEVLASAYTDKKIIKLTNEAIAAKKPYTVELLISKKDGTPAWISASATPIINEAGNVERQIKIVADITERKYAEEQLNLLSLVASKTANGVIICDKDGKIKWINQAFEELTGYTLQELKGHRPGDFLTGERSNLQDLEEARLLTLNGKSSHIELLCYKKDKTPMWLSISNTPTFKDGILDQQVEITKDISTRKLAENELIKTREEAVILSKAKETFLSIMSHEIRTPLNAVIGMTHILIDDNPTQSQLENLKILLFSAQNLLMLINDILDFTKIETGNMFLEKANVNLKNLVSQTLNSLQFKTAEKSVVLKSQVDHRIPSQIRGDNTRLYQILVNLLGNSIKFTEKGEINLKLDLVSESEKSVIIRFEITDSGIGIPDDKINYIFDTYTQASTDTTRKYGGTGLGLAITKRLIELHNSSISVESKLGKGSVFSFVIEFERSQQLFIPLEIKPQRINLGSFILVVDDNEINRLLVDKMLAKWGISVDFAENGEIALQKVQKNIYDLVLMDLHMPVMGGIDSTIAIRKLDGDYYTHLPIIALTASILTHEMDKIYECGMNDYILKPFIPDNLYRKIKLYLKN
jgi:PAS domain S-box-containing protein